MNRFSSLEFDDADKSRSKPSSGEDIRDDTYFYKEAVRSWLGGDFELALRNYSRTLERNSSFSEAWSGQIMMLIELGEYPEAVTWSDKALELFPEHTEFLALKAIAYNRDAKYDKAVAFSDNSVSKENVTSRAWLGRAEVMIRRKSRVAESCLSKAISIAGNERSLVELEAARILSRSKRYSSAIEYLNRVIRILPKSALAWYELGRCQRHLGFSEARTSLGQCLNIRPLWVPAENELRKVKDRGFLYRTFKQIFGK